MFAVLMVVGGVCVAGMAVIGLVAVTTGWTPRFTGIEQRPRMWGSGVLLSAVGLTAFLFLGPFNSSSHPDRNLPLVGMAVNFVGLALQSLARRPRSLPQPPTKTTAS